MTDTPPNNPFAPSIDESASDEGDQRRRTAAQRLMAEFGTKSEVQAPPPQTDGNATETAPLQAGPFTLPPLPTFTRPKPVPEGESPAETQAETQAEPSAPATISEEGPASPTVTAIAEAAPPPAAAPANPAVNNPFATPLPSPTPEPSAVIVEEDPPSPTVATAAAPFTVPSNPFAPADSPAPAANPFTPEPVHIPEEEPASPTVLPSNPLPFSEPDPSPALSQVHQEVARLKEELELERRKSAARSQSAINAALGDAEQTRKQLELLQVELTQSRESEASLRRILEATQPQSATSHGGPSTAGGYDVLVRENQQLTSKVQELEKKLHDIHMTQITGGATLSQAISQEKLDKVEQAIEWAKTHPTLAVAGGLAIVIIISILGGN